MIDALENVAAMLATELEQHDEHGEPFDADIVRLAVRRLRAQIEMQEEGISE